MNDQRGSEMTDAAACGGMTLAVLRKLSGLWQL
ncbi:hypothetical protein M2283_001077 [Streptomyces pseudovenezuelae]|uniref:Transcriptional regulator n=1 Tax=Streptomyces pseudovenezuelae TaxID=67350 RepID=A0ABT6LEL0_9ACTN|nr:hypothetical protein [Streptomyces pseudovenezuelae]